MDMLTLPIFSLFSLDHYHYFQNVLAKYDNFFHESLAYIYIRRSITSLPGSKPVTTVFILFFVLNIQKITLWLCGLYNSEVYLDNIDNFFKTWKEQTNGFTVTPHKCGLGIEETNWLGYWFTPTGHKPSEKCISIILDHKPQTTNHKPPQTSSEWVVSLVRLMLIGSCSLDGPICSNHCLTNQVKIFCWTPEIYIAS